MNIKLFIYGLLSLFVLVTGSSCDDDTPVHVPKRTVLVYMAADNNLSAFGQTNIQDMLKGATAASLNHGNLLVYFDPSNGDPQLLQITINKQGASEKKVIKTYPEQNSASGDVLSAVINEVIDDPRFDADSYGLLLWSHGTAWLPTNYKNMLKSFGQDGSNFMEIPQLAQAIPDHVFDFILFDACYMGSIEVAYELRNKADYIIGSSVEIMGSGFPYDLIIEPLFRKTADLVGVCDNFYNYYNQQSGAWQSASIAIIDMKGLPALKEATRAILQGKEAEVKAMPVNDIQALDYLTTRRLLYDFDDFIGHFASGSAYTTYTTALGEAIIYKKTTPNSTYGLNGGTSIPIRYFSGLNVYIPREAFLSLNEWYTQLEWYKAIYQ